jgi:hypothetical protein
MFEPMVDEMEPQETLRFLADRRAAADAEEAALLLGVGHWADLHPQVHPDDDPDWWCLDEFSTVGGERVVGLAGDGAPLVAEFALADLATALRLTQGAARALMADTLELRHRLPLVWARIHDGRLQAWRARRIAQHTTTLSRQAAAWVDRQVAPIAHKISPGRLERLVGAAILKFDPGSADQDCNDARDSRGVWIADPDQNGLVGVLATVDAPAARALDRTLDRGAEALAALGDTSSHDVRRSVALGLLADPQAALDLLAGRTPDAKTDLVLYVHLDQATLAGDRGTARVEGLPDLHALPLQTLRDWAGHANITVKPVIDCNAQLTSPGYQPSPAQREQTRLKDPTCVFPWCDKPGRNHDLDHIVAYDDHGPPDQTSSDNLARLCRFHHRLKTHGRWRYRREPDGSYLWTSPHGDTWIIDHTGTTPLSKPA